MGYDSAPKKLFRLADSMLPLSFQTKDREHARFIIECTHIDPISGLLRCDICDKLIERYIENVGYSAENVEIVAKHLEKVHGITASGN